MPHEGQKHPLFMGTYVEFPMDNNATIYFSAQNAICTISKFQSSFTIIINNNRTKALANTLILHFYPPILASNA